MMEAMHGVMALLLITGGDAFTPMRAFPVRRHLTSTTTTTTMMASGPDGGDVARLELVSVVKTFAASNLGAANPSLLSDDFVCSGPDFVVGRKDSYVAGLTKETQVFQAALPDFDLRPYGFMVDETRPDTVWFKIRPRGTATGPFAYKGEVYAPNDQTVELPIQQLSVTVRGGKVSRVTAGYSVDKQSGNTGGLMGPQGVLYALGEKPSPFSYLPLAVALGQLVGRTRKPPARVARASPFPEPVMFSLAKRVAETSYGAEEPDLLTRDFTFSAPLVGPLTKDAHVRRSNAAGIKAGLPDLKVELYNFEIDAFDPERVWLILKASGTQTRAMLGPDGSVVKAAPDGATAPRYESAPEAVSISLNEKGLCYRATAGYVLDKEVGNTKGLGGALGLLEAVGAGRPFFETRTLGDVPRLLTEAVAPPASTIRPAAPPAAARPAAVAPAPAVAVAPAPAPMAPAAAPLPPKVVEKKVESVRPAAVEKAAAPAAPVAPKAVEKKAPPASPLSGAEKKDAKAPENKAEPASAGFFSFLGGGAPAAPKSVPPTKPVAATTAAPPAASQAAKQAAPASGGFFSFLESAPAAAPVPPIKAVTPTKAAPPAAPAKAPISALKKETTVAAAVPKQAEAKKEAGGGFFSFLDSAPSTPSKAPVDKVPVVAKAPAPSTVGKKSDPVQIVSAPAPAAKKEAGGGFFSFLDSAPAAAPAAPAVKVGSAAAKAAPAPAKLAAASPAPNKVDVKTTTLPTATLKRAPAAPAAPASPAAVAKKDDKAPSSGGIFSFLGGGSREVSEPKPSTPAPPATASVSAKKPAATLKKAEPAKVAPAVPAKAPPPSGGGFFGLFGGSPAPAPAAPAAPSTPTTSSKSAPAAVLNAKSKAASAKAAEVKATLQIERATKDAAARADKIKAAVDTKRAQQEKATADAAAKVAAEKAKREASSKARQDDLARQLKAVNAAEKTQREGKAAPAASANFFIDELDKKPAPADTKSAAGKGAAASKGATVKVGTKVGTKGKESGFV